MRIAGRLSMKRKLGEAVIFNPTERLPKGTLAKKVTMDKLQPFTRDILTYEVESYNGGAKFRNGDTIMARITPCLENGKTAFINFLEEDEVGYGSTEFIVWRALADATDRDYVYYLAQNSEIRDVAIKSMVGSSGRQRVQQSVLDNYEIDLPDIESQRAIAATLSCLDDKIANNTKINHHLEQIARAIFKSWFVDFEPWGGVMPDDWQESTLSNIANITMGQSPDGTSYNENNIGTVFYQGRAEFGSRFPTRRLFTTQPKRMASKGDVLISVRAPVGDLNVAFEPCCLGRGLASIQSNSECPSFILYTMFALKKQLDVFNGEGTVFGSINKNDMANLPILIPSNEVIHQFEELVKPMDAIIETNYAENCNFQVIRDTLLPCLMSGELRVG
jgi:type I restriction enzyme S subunit